MRRLIVAALLLTAGCGSVPMAGPGDQDKLDASAAVCRDEITAAHFLVPGLSSAETMRSCMRQLGWAREPDTFRTYRWVGR